MSFKEYLTEAAPTLVKVTKDVYQGTNTATIDYRLFVDTGSMPVKSITGVKASDRHKFESDLEKAVIAVFNKYKNIGS